MLYAYVKCAYSSVTLYLFLFLFISRNKPTNRALKTATAINTTMTPAAIPPVLTPTFGAPVAAGPIPVMDFSKT